MMYWLTVYGLITIVVFVGTGIVSLAVAGIWWSVRAIQRIRETVSLAT